MKLLAHPLLPVALAALSLLSGCTTTTVPEPPAELRRYLLDDFERDGLWTLDSADNYGLVKYSGEDATRGKSLMRLAFFDNGRGKTMFRREVRYDLGSAGRLWLDVLNPNAGAGVECALAFRTDNGGYYETAAESMSPGWNRDVEFTLDALGMKAGTDLDAWQAHRHKVTRAMILVFPGENEKGSVSVDNLRADVPGVNREVRPHMVRADAPPKLVRRYEPIEISLEFTRESVVDEGAPEPGTLMPVRLEARLTAPDGEKKVVTGFLKENDEESGGNVTYAVRFLADVSGQWGLDFGYVAGRQWRSVSGRGFFCGRSLWGSGKPRIDPDDPRFFSLSSGSFLYPLGQNVCWAADYEPYLKAIYDYDGNFVRVWICSWNNPLLEQDNYRRINLASAKEIDRIFDLARKYHVYVQLVLAQHGSLISDWQRNPFNAENGGPCGLRQDFWVNWKARAAFKRYLRYVVARWSHHPNLFALELVNEADYAERYRNEDIIKWHREMSDYLKRVDPNGNLVTTSVVSHKDLAEVWELPAVDFTTSHLYGKDPAAALERARVFHKGYHKPYFVGEMGLSWRAAGDQIDQKGVHLHHALWLAWMTPTSGNVLPWWWDTHIEPNKLHRHFEALAAYSRGEDRRGRHLRPWSVAVKSGTPTRIQGLADRVSAYGFVYDPERIEQPDVTPGRGVLPQKHDFEIRGLLDGEYAFQVWDTAKGRVAVQRTATCSDSVLRLVLPASEEDFAFKAKRIGESAIRVSVEKTGETVPP